MSAGEDLIFEFAQRARPGELLLYGRGDHPPRDLVRVMRPLVDCGVLLPVRKREGKGFAFQVQRGSADMSSALARRQSRQSRGTTRRRRVRKSSLTMVFDCLVRAAKAGAPCPTNDELARKCRLSGKLAASYRMRRLVTLGRISVVDHSPWGRRVVTIITGPHAGAQTCEAAL